MINTDPVAADAETGGPSDATVAPILRTGAPGAVVLAGHRDRGHCSDLVRVLSAGIRASGSNAMSERRLRHMTKPRRVERIERRWAAVAVVVVLVFVVVATLRRRAPGRHCRRPALRPPTHARCI